MRVLPRLSKKGNNTRKTPKKLNRDVDLVSTRSEIGIIL